MKTPGPRTLVKVGLFIALVVVVGTIFEQQSPNFASLAYPPIPESYYPIISDAISYCQMPTRMRSLIASVIWKESTFHASSISGGGAVGLMQVLRGTAKGVADEHQIAGLTASTLTDPKINIYIGTCYLKDKYDEFGNGNDSTYDDPKITAAVLMSYNAGSGAGQAYLAGNMPESSYSRRIREAMPVYALDIAHHDQAVAAGIAANPPDVRTFIWKVILGNTTAS